MYVCRAPRSADAAGPANGPPAPGVGVAWPALASAPYSAVRRAATRAAIAAEVTSGEAAADIPGCGEGVREPGPPPAAARASVAAATARAGRRRAGRAVRGRE